MGNTIWSILILLILQQAIAEGGHSGVFFEAKPSTGATGGWSPESPEVPWISQASPGAKKTDLMSPGGPSG